MYYILKSGTFFLLKKLELNFKLKKSIKIKRNYKRFYFIESFLKSYREEVAIVTEDRILHYDIEKSIAFLNSFQIDFE